MRVQDHFEISISGSGLPSHLNSRPRSLEAPIPDDSLLAQVQPPYLSQSVFSFTIHRLYILAAPQSLASAQRDSNTFLPTRIRQAADPGHAYAEDSWTNARLE
jgi:hypothetical protein